MNKEEKAAYMRKWRAENREAQRAYWKEYNKVNRKARREAGFKSYEKHQERHREEALIERISNPRKYIYKNTKSRAKTLGISFSLELTDIPEIPDICPISLIPIVITKRKMKGPALCSPSLDKIDPALGYIPGNVRIISHKANAWKSNMTQEDVERLLQYIKGEI